MPIHHSPSSTDRRAVLTLRPAPPLHQEPHAPGRGESTRRPTGRLVSRRRIAGSLGVGAAAALLLSACATAGPGAPVESSPAGAASSPVASSPVASSSAAGTSSRGTSGPASSGTSESDSSAPVGSASATGSATASGRGTPGGDGDLQTHSTEGGHFRWTLPADWSITEELAGPDTTEAYGVKNERWVFQDPEETVVFSADTGVGPTDNDGPKPDVVEVLDAEPLPDVPVSEDGGPSGEAWYRAALLRANDAVAGLPPYFADDEYVLTVQVVTVPEGVDPESAGDDYWSAWTYVLPPAEGVQEGTASFLRGHITRSDAEAITGEEGEDALRAVLETPQYAGLRDVATSLEVTAP